MSNSTSRFAQLDNNAIDTILREDSSATAYSICRDKMFPASVSMMMIRRKMQDMIKTGHLPESKSPLNEDAQPSDFGILPHQGTHKNYTDSESKQFWDWTQSRPDPMFRNILRIDVPAVQRILPGRTLLSASVKLYAMIAAFKRDGVNEAEYPGSKSPPLGIAARPRNCLAIDPEKHWTKWTFDEEENLRQWLLSRKEPFGRGLMKIDVPVLERLLPGRSWEAVRNKTLKLVKMIREEYEVESEDEAEGAYDADRDDNGSSDDSTPLFELDTAQTSKDSGKQAVANDFERACTDISANMDGVLADESTAKMLMDLNKHDSLLRYVEHPEEMSTDSDLTDLSPEIGQTPIEEATAQWRTGSKNHGSPPSYIGQPDERSKVSDLTDMDSEMSETHDGSAAPSDISETHEEWAAQVLLDFSKNAVVFPSTIRAQQTSNDANFEVSGASIHDDEMEL